MKCRHCSSDIHWADNRPFKTSEEAAEFLRVSTSAELAKERSEHQPLTDSPPAPDDLASVPTVPSQTSDASATKTNFFDSAAFIQPTEPADRHEWLRKPDRLFEYINEVNLELSDQFTAHQQWFQNALFIPRVILWGIGFGAFWLTSEASEFEFEFPEVTLFTGIAALVLAIAIQCFLHWLQRLNQHRDLETVLWKYLPRLLRSEKWQAELDGIASKAERDTSCAEVIDSVEMVLRGYLRSSPDDLKTRRMKHLTSTVVAHILVESEIPLDLSRLQILPRDIANILATHKGAIQLRRIKSMSLDVAEALATHDGAIDFKTSHFVGGTLQQEVARFIIQSQSGFLVFPELTELEPNAARILSSYQGVLYLDGLRNLSPEVASLLVKHKGGLSLKGLTSLTSDAAAELSKVVGFIHLGGVRELSLETAAKLLGVKGLGVRESTPHAQTSCIDFDDSAEREALRGMELELQWASFGDADDVTAPSPWLPSSIISYDVALSSGTCFSDGVCLAGLAYVSDNLLEVMVKSGRTIVLNRQAVNSEWEMLTSGPQRSDTYLAEPMLSPKEKKPAPFRCELGDVDEFDLSVEGTADEFLTAFNRSDNAFFGSGVLGEGPVDLTNQSEMLSSGAFDSALSHYDIRWGFSKWSPSGWLERCLCEPLTFDNTDPEHPWDTSTTFYYQGRWRRKCEPIIFALSIALIIAGGAAIFYLPYLLLSFLRATGTVSLTDWGKFLLALLAVLLGFSEFRSLFGAWHRARTW